MKCIICGEREEGNNHHCDPKKEQRIENGRWANVDREYPKNYGTRLAVGFAMIGGENG